MNAMRISSPNVRFILLLLRPSKLTDPYLRQITVSSNRPNLPHLRMTISGDAKKRNFNAYLKCRAPTLVGVADRLRTGMTIQGFRQAVPARPRPLLHPVFRQLGWGHRGRLQCHSDPVLINFPTQRFRVRRRRRRIPQAGTRLPLILPHRGRQIRR